MPAIELIYDDDCPNVPAARQALRQACEVAGLPPSWKEWERSAAAAPGHVLAYGSPTILVDGVDVAGEGAAADAACCRVYRDRDGRLRGVPDVETVAGALRVGASRRASGWLPAAGALFAGGGALLPTLSCPACWPAYASLLSTLGIGFVNYTPYLGPVLVGLVGASLAGLVPGGRRRRDVRPLLIGGLGGLVLLAGRFWAASEPVAWLGIGLLGAAAVLNGLAERRAGRMCHVAAT